MMGPSQMAGCELANRSRAVFRLVVTHFGNKGCKTALLSNTGVCLGDVLPDASAHLGPCVCDLDPRCCKLVDRLFMGSRRGIVDGKKSINSVDSFADH